MSDLKLAKLPDRTPVKIRITVSPDLNKALHAYAELYRETYGEARVRGGAHPIHPGELPRERPRLRQGP